MNHSLHWSLLASTALALLLATSMSTRSRAVPANWFSTAAASAIERSLDALTPVLSSAGPNAAKAPEPAAVSLLLAGIASAWLVRRRVTVPSC